MRPPGAGRLVPESLVAHCLLVERDSGLLLIDTGFSTADVADPSRLPWFFRQAMGPALDATEPAIAQIRALGLDPGDVTDLALTHLDLDHAGGLVDFPAATVHVYADELHAARHPRPQERARYRSVQWAHGPKWREHRIAGESWRGFESVTALGDDVLLVPLLGHTRGHCGVAVRTGDDEWLLHAGDSYFHAGEVLTPPSYNRTLSVFQSMIAASNSQRRRNQERLRDLVADHPEIRVFSAHDPTEFAALSG